jgi:hypothetical protein
MEKQHTHELKFVRFADIPGHIHSYSTRTSYNDGHRHRVRGRTSPPYRIRGGHAHYYEGTTSFDDGHTHHFRGWTGPPIPLPDGGHYHEFWGVTSFDDGHTHTYRGATGEDYR